MTDKSWRVALDNPSLPNHDAEVAVIGGTDDVDWSGTVTMKRDGAYLIPQH